jgi:hypothetical protein
VKITIMHRDGAISGVAMDPGSSIGITMREGKPEEGQEYPDRYAVVEVQDNDHYLEITLSAQDVRDVSEGTATILPEVEMFPGTGRTLQEEARARAAEPLEIEESEPALD